MLCEKYLHELALNIIGRFLNAKRDKYLVLNTLTVLNIDFYPDADFDGNYGHYESTD